MLHSIQEGREVATFHTWAAHLLLCLHCRVRCSRSVRFGKRFTSLESPFVLAELIDNTSAELGVSDPPGATVSTAAAG